MRVPEVAVANSVPVFIRLSDWMTTSQTIQSPSRPAADFKVLA